MSEDNGPKPPKFSQEDFDARMNRIAVALAKREALVDSWISNSPASQNRPPPKTDAELDAEDAELFKPQPPYLGVGAAIPAEWLANDSEREKKALKAKLMPTKGLRASKARDAEEKAASAKRGLDKESSDEEEGRSGLGRAKKVKRAPVKEHPAVLLMQATSESKEEQSLALEIAGTEDRPATEQTFPMRASAGQGNAGNAHVKEDSNVMSSEVVPASSSSTAEIGKIQDAEEGNAKQGMTAMERKKAKKAEQKKKKRLERRNALQSTE